MVKYCKMEQKEYMQQYMELEEKYNVNLVSGTANISYPLSITSNRSDFNPQLNLSYNSGNGNSIFGLGGA